MIYEQVFICWHANQEEGDGVEIKADSIRSAAKKAVDIWRHEQTQEFHGSKITVFVKDEAKRTHQLIISSSDGDEQSQATYP